MELDKVLKGIYGDQYINRRQLAKFVKSQQQRITELEREVEGWIKSHNEAVEDGLRFVEQNQQLKKENSELRKCLKSVLNYRTFIVPTLIDKIEQLLKDK